MGQKGKKKVKSLFTTEKQNARKYMIFNFSKNQGNGN